MAAAPSVTCEQSVTLMRPPDVGVVGPHGARVVVAHEPVARLGIGVELGIGVVDGRDPGEVLVLEAEATVVFVAELAKQLGERELDPLRLAVVPGCGPEKVAASFGVDVLHLLDADDQETS